MNNGIFNTIEFYDQNAENNDDDLNANLTLEERDEEMIDSGLDDNEIDEMIPFLETLNDDNFDQTIPERVPSGLTVGGNIQ